MYLGLTWYSSKCLSRSVGCSMSHRGLPGHLKSVINENKNENNRKSGMENSGPKCLWRKSPCGQSKQWKGETHVGDWHPFVFVFVFVFVSRVWHDPKRVKKKTWMQVIDFPLPIHSRAVTRVHERSKRRVVNLPTTNSPQKYQFFSTQTKSGLCMRGEAGGLWTWPTEV